MTRESVKKQQLGGLTMEEYIEQGYETDVFILIDEVFDDFESRTCESCKYWICTDSITCDLGFAYDLNDTMNPDWGCIRWEKKDDDSLDRFT